MDINESLIIAKYFFIFEIMARATHNESFLFLEFDESSS